MSLPSTTFIKRSAGVLKPIRFFFAKRRTGTLATVETSRYQESAIQRELFLNVLNAHVTKRDAKQFLTSFKLSNTATKVSARTESPGPQQGLSVDSQSGQRRSPTSRYDLSQEPILEPQQVLHLSLVCFKSPETVDDSILNGFAVTLSQLVKLGMHLIVILDSNPPLGVSKNRAANSIKTTRGVFAKQAERLCQAIERHSPERTQSIPTAFDCVEATLDGQHPQDGSPIKVAIPDQLSRPLGRGLTLIVPSMAYTASGQLLPVSSKEVMACLTRHFASAVLTTMPTPHRIDIDRVIVVDAIGGIPSKVRSNGARVFVNLEQQLGGIQQQLSADRPSTEAGPFSAEDGSTCKRHLNNLDMIHKCLELLPAASSGLILDPAAAANPSPPGRNQKISPIREVRPKNILIHNLLTNRPVVSASLPIARIAPLDQSALTNVAAPTATLVKRGMPVVLVPAEQADGWTRPIRGSNLLKLDDDVRIDFPRLVHLINDSFRRNLDVPDYLARVKNRVAGIVVAGDYEGGAIFTWEMPPGTNDPARLVPYLDKFAVLQSSQGSSGVADAVYQAMVEECFPAGVCWRSRKDNPVNKWYFERAAGSWQIPGSGWTMFWTGEEGLSKERLQDYAAICANIRHSWMDVQKPV
ncbi:Amino-acid acetyltransferase, mitochondrial [Elasticomyces elasticus]|nr:Amino-acid acetyltransferase, mitochondrial [Elasticomyces elasticus]